ncbi:hypothetical protein HCN44_004494 [Aphidius gifuensis]|uniref:Cuticular protein n=1 Tax=Aphidius gifuensis TaxID=684658 RepID=A0A834XZ65_APHGI|nr:regulator of nonsense transcripts 1-like [Aphidius gifuensis]KAF7995022.1 hypothetical protein HCN44_004494 [Aphidius gifuensis]
MAFKFIVLCTFLATVNAGVASDNTYRNPTSESKTVTSYSSNSNTGVRANNPSLYVTSSPSYETYASPAQVYGKTATIQQAVNYHAHPESLAYTQQAVQLPQATYTNYQAPQQYNVVQKQYQQAAVQIPQTTYTTYQAPQQQQQHLVYQQYEQAAPHSFYSPSHYYNQPAHVLPITHQPHQTVYSHASPAAIKIQYSPAAEVAHLSYSNVNDHINYAW